MFSPIVTHEPGVVIVHRDVPERPTLWYLDPASARQLAAHLIREAARAEADDTPVQPATKP